MSTRHYISIATAILIVIILFLTRHELVQAWNLLQRVDLRILALIIPLQAISYYAVGAMIFSYLKQTETMKANSVEMAKMALELNFVNHILPSGGVSGASYMTWRLKHLGVGAARATLAQVVRFAVTFLSFLILLLISLLMITIDGNISRFMILVTSGVAFSIIFVTLVVIYMLNDRKRLYLFSLTITAWVNRFWMNILRRPKALLLIEKVSKFFRELHADYRMLRKEPGLLKRPLIWGFIFNIAEVSMFAIAFWALGTPINPAPLLIAYGVATIAGFFVVTPGGAGGYELLMITILASAGINQGASVAAVLLTRTLLILGTILSGYIFYHKALEKYGKHPVKS